MTGIVPLRQFEIHPDADPENVSWVSKLLSYGVWSGPGYTAGYYALPIDKLTPELEAQLGIDAYDNYVAKPHDLNEFRAEGTLLGKLAGLGFLDQNADVVRSDVGQIIDRRFVDVQHYIDQAGDEATRQSAVKASIDYVVHIISSNNQWAVDVTKNGVNMENDYAVPMAIQNMLADNIFLHESTSLREFLGDVNNPTPGTLLYQVQ